MWSNQNHNLSYYHSISPLHSKEVLIMATSLKLSKIIISLMVSLQHHIHKIIVPAENSIMQQICMLPRATANYIFEVRTWSYSNPTSRLANGQQCSFYNGLSCQPSTCNNRFYYCVRDLGSTESDCNGGKTSPIYSSKNYINFESSTVRGLPNPLPLPGLTREWKVS